MIISLKPIAATMMSLLLLAAVTLQGETVNDVVVVDTGTVLRDVTSSPLGINFNYLRDDPSLRPAGSTEIGAAIATLGGHWLRYPGGEKSDWHFFAPAPYEKPAPVTIGKYKTYRKEALDFDEYIELVSRLNGVPYIVAGYDSPARTGVSESEYIAHAVGWVRYANIIRHKGIKYWEIGNENYLNNTATVEQMVAVVTKFSRAMKAVDPSIKIGTSAGSRGWTEALVNGAGGEIDFISYSNYFNSNSGQGYAKYAGPKGANLISRGQMIADVIAASKYRGRIEVIAAEFGAVDFSKVLPMKQRWEGNDLGHALAIFDMAGQFLRERRITAAMFWGTRWMDDMNPVRRCYALGAKNEIMPVGEPLALWHRFLQPQMVSATALTEGNSFASYDPSSGAISIFLINKGSSQRQARIEFTGKTPVGPLNQYRFSGRDPADTDPKFESVTGARIEGAALSDVTLAPYSVTILTTQLRR